MIICLILILAWTAAFGFAGAFLAGFVSFFVLLVFRVTELSPNLNSMLTFWYVGSLLLGAFGFLPGVPGRLPGTKPR